MTLEDVVVARRRVRTEARGLRRHLGLSLRDVADAIESSPSSVCRWERGARVGGYPAVRYMRLLDQLMERGGS